MDDSSANPDAISSQEIVARLALGDSAAEQAVFDRYLKRLTMLARGRLSRKLAARLDAEDVVMSAYRSFFVGARLGRYQLTHGGDLWRLLVEITLHKLYRQTAHHSAQRRSVGRESHVAESQELGALAFSRAPTPEEVAAASEQLENVLLQLPQLGRRVLELRLQGERLDEIATALNCSERTVRRMLKQAREAIERDPN